jgi:hypothetical protein
MSDLVGLEINELNLYPQIGSRTEAVGSGLAALQRAIDRAAEKAIR